ncbi:FAD-dependent oxidoreductase [Alphaproteobacteria bacterium]|nr:FAD-dependent oxidoreductase [Alphaproteobacteria bacterium]
MNKFFPKLFSEIEIGSCTLKNRIVSPGHHTYLCDDVPGEALIAYHEARAKGGAGLIISEIVAVHETAGFSASLLKAQNRDVIPHYKRLVDTCQNHGARNFAQLFHPGREILSAKDGMLPVSFAPSAVPNERFHIMPKPMSDTLIRDIISGFGNTAAILAEAGFDGFEIVGSHGYLPAQFLNPRTNLRDDTWGGDFERRLAFVQETARAIRRKAPGKAVGLRISATEMDSQGLTNEEVILIAEALSKDLDYLSVVAGTSASLGGSVHISPPMGLDHAYVAPFAATVKAAAKIPIIVTGRINQPQIAEQVIANGEADLCGMNRAMICDSQMAVKAQTGRFDDIRACIGCNQACIGRAHKGLGISCIQHPESGRELIYSKLPSIQSTKTIAVIGGGPAGMKAAAVAAARGHKVSLFEADKQLGGQAKLAQRLPGRAEFGGIIDNLEKEMLAAGVNVVKGQSVDRDFIKALNPDSVILATGAKPYTPSLEGLDAPSVVNAWDVLEGRANVGASVVIADWRADWIGLGLAEQLASNGSSVTLCINAALAGETLQLYTRNHYVGRLHKLGVKIQTHARLFGADGDTVYFQDTLSEDPIIYDGIDTLVLSLGHQANNCLERQLDNMGNDIDIEMHTIGDAVVPRTAEEAVFEGLELGWKI